MKYRIIALFAALLCTATVSTPAQAGWDWRPTAVQQGPLPIPTATLSSYKFWPVSPSADICVAVGDTVAPIGAMAQAWNNATGHTLRLNAAGNCLTETQQNGTVGYPPSRRMTIDTYSAADGNCWKVTNNSPYPTYYTYNESFREWTNNPVGWVNRYYEGCWSTALLRQKMTAIVEGVILGANELHGSQWNGRGMSATSALYGPSANTDGKDVGNLYDDFYTGVY